MPSVSKAQQHLMAAAEHGADFPMAKKIRKSMSHQQMHDFAVGSMKSKPEHVGTPHDQVKRLRRQGKSEFDANKAVMKHPNRHKNLGAFLHKSKKS